MVNQRINPFVVLNIEADATDEQIKKKYRDLLKKYHPDLNQNSKQAQEQTELITKAYKMLAHTTVDDRKYMFRQLTANLAGQRKLKKITTPTPTDSQPTDESITHRERLRKVWCEQRLKRKRDWAESILHNAEQSVTDTKQPSKQRKSSTTTNTNKVEKSNASKSNQRTVHTDKVVHQFQKQQTVNVADKATEHIATHTDMHIHSSVAPDTPQQSNAQSKSLENIQIVADNKSCHSDINNKQSDNLSQVQPTVVEKAKKLATITAQSQQPTTADNEYWLDIPQQFFDKLPKSKHSVNLDANALKNIFGKVTMLALQKRDKIWAVGYDALTMTLFVQIKNAKIIAHTHVPVATFVELRNAPKPIAYWRANIKKQYTRTEWKL